MYDSLISAAQLRDELESPDLLIIDCRFDLADAGKGERMYHESHLPGAFYAHLDFHLSSPITPRSGRHPLPNRDAFGRWLGECGFDGGQQVIAYDDSGCAMASRLWWLLRCMGHQKVACLDGGWQAWMNVAGPLSADVPETKPGEGFDGGLASGCVAGTAEVVANIDEQDFLLVDVRAAQRFRGEQEPIDPVAGHVPGAVNLPLTENLDGNGCYKSPALLRELYAPLIERLPVERQVHMCGSGVTACHSVLALAWAGLGLPRVYAGSWSEWIRDPERPVVTETT